MSNQIAIQVPWIAGDNIVQETCPLIILLLVWRASSNSSLFHKARLSTEEIETSFTQCVSTPLQNVQLVQKSYSCAWEQQE